LGKGKGISRKGEEHCEIKTKNSQSAEKERKKFRRGAKKIAVRTVQDGGSHGRRELVKPKGKPAPDYRSCCETKGEPKKKKKEKKGDLMGKSDEVGGGKFHQKNTVGRQTNPHPGGEKVMLFRGGREGRWLGRKKAARLGKFPDGWEGVSVHPHWEKKWLGRDAGGEKQSGETAETGPLAD